MQWSKRKRLLLYLVLGLHGIFLIVTASVQFYSYIEHYMTEQIFRHEAQNLDFTPPTYLAETQEGKGIIQFRGLNTRLSTDEQSNPKRQAFVTLINTEAYVTAAATLAQSLNEANSTRKLVVMVTGNVSDAALEPLRILGCVVLRRLPLAVPTKILKTFLWASWEHAFSKLLIWTLTEYDKLVWMDVDTVVLRNMDDIFDFPELSATRDFGGFSTCSLKRRINSGLMVVAPNPSTLDGILEFFTTLTTLYDGDQELIYKYFASMRRVNRISQNYLLFIGRCRCMGETQMPSDFRLPPSVKALHFSGHVIDFKTATHKERKEEPCARETFPIWRGFYDRMRATVEAAGGRRKDPYDYNEGPSMLTNEPD